MPATAHKTDNHNPAAKLDLRRHFLRKYHAGQKPRVLDCCEGNRLIWTTLLKEFDCTYWGVDQKPKKGRLMADSVRILQQPGWQADVVDIDTYGSPWKHWFAMLPNVAKPVTVFLTFGLLKVNGSYGGAKRAAPLPEMQAMGLVFPTLLLPGGLAGRIVERCVPYCLDRARSHGLRIVEAMEAVSDGNARYYGVRLEPEDE